jgi:hypothetical protein
MAARRSAKERNSKEKSMDTKDEKHLKEISERRAQEAPHGTVLRGDVFELHRADMEKRRKGTWQIENWFFVDDVLVNVNFFFRCPFCSSINRDCTRLFPTRRAYEARECVTCWKCRRHSEIRMIGMRAAICQAVERRNSHSRKG